MTGLESQDYIAWLEQIKAQVQSAQQKAVLTVNKELIELYYTIGSSIISQQKEQGWGTKVVKQLAHDLKNAFPQMKGFSATNLNYMRKFAAAWPDKAILQQLAVKLPWFHICTVMDKIKSPEQRIWYMEKTIEHGWSRNVLLHHIEARLIDREGAAVTNFSSTLPAPHSELAHQTIKDPYIFDFLNIGNEEKERGIENALTAHISQFLIELGTGFAFVGKQYHLEVGGDDFYIDLLFYHLDLRCYIVVELKAGNFKPEHTGQLNFYLSAVDSLLKRDIDQPTIGLLLCRSRNKIVAEYALRNNSSPIGVAQYQLDNALPKDLEDKLPSIEKIEHILASDIDGLDAKQMKK